MPNRILKESICRSEEIDSLTWFEEVLFYRLIVVCDDFGRFDGRIKIIKGSCFPLKNITEKDIERALNKLSAVGLVRVYEAQGRPYLQLVTWAAHQRIRNQKSKYPEEDSRRQLLSIDSNGQQKETIDNKCVRNPIQSESNAKSKSDICSEQTGTEQTDMTPAPDTNTQTAVITLPLNTGKEYSVTQADINTWAELYPCVDIMQELRKMKGWCMSNPKKCKTANGIKRFINTWLAKEQDRGGAKQSAGENAHTVSSNRFNNFSQRDYDYNEFEKNFVNKGLV